MRRFLWLMVAAVLGAGLAAEAAADRTELIVEVANAVTMGEFTYEDATISVSEEFFNPRACAELHFGGTPFAVGLDYAQSENTFDGEYDESSGTLDVERTEFGLFLRMGHRNRSNIRVGYRSFDYDISNGSIDHVENGIVTERDRNGTATGSLTTGIDAEFTLALGQSLQFALTVGGTYFFDAEYDWAYDRTVGGSTTRETGTATLDAVTVKVRPEVSIPLSTDLRLFANYTVSASAWTGDIPEEDEYPGVDIYSAAAVGLRYAFGL